MIFSPNGVVNLLRGFIILKHCTYGSIKGKGLLEGGDYSQNYGISQTGSLRTKNLGI